MAPLRSHPNWQNAKMRNAMHGCRLGIDCARRRARVEPSEIIEKSRKVWASRDKGHKWPPPLNCLFVFVCTAFNVRPQSHIRSYTNTHGDLCAPPPLIYGHSQLGNINIFCSEANSDLRCVLTRCGRQRGQLASSKLIIFAFCPHKPGICIRA